MLSRSNPPGVSHPTGRYSLVSLAKAGASLAWLSGQTGRRHDTTMAEDPVSQTCDAFANLAVLMDSVGGSPSDIACLRTYVTEGPQEGFYRGRDRVFSDWYPHGDYPASTLLVIGGLADPRAVVEIEAVLALHGG